MAAQGLSYRRGEEDVPELDGTTFSYVDQWALECPEKCAYVIQTKQERESITFGELKKSTDNLAVWFSKFGLEKGDRVGILSHNCLAYILCEFALARIGVVSCRFYVSLDSKGELTRSFTNTKCRLLLCQAESLPSIFNVISVLTNHDPSLGRLTCADLPMLEQVITLYDNQSSGIIQLPHYTTIHPSELEMRCLMDAQASISSNDDCTIYCTSGSTGAPKYVINSHRAVMRTFYSSMKRAGIEFDDIYFEDRPMAHVGGVVVTALQFGITMVIGDSRITTSSSSSSSADKEYLPRLFREENVTCGMCFPYILYDMIKNNQCEDFVDFNLKFFVFGGQLANYLILKKINDVLSVPLVNIYGTTETSDITSCHAGDSIEVISNYAGSVLPYLELKITDNDGNIVPYDQEGNIATRSPYPWRYLDEEKTRNSFDSDGYFYPGDVGKMAPNGYVQILGRSDDAINVGTIKVYPTSTHFEWSYVLI